jgi:predicted metal-binding membrane protein
MSPSGARDPAVAIHVAAAVCWAATAALAVAGVPGGCHDAAAGTRGSEPSWPLAFALWLLMVGAMMLPTVVPLARLFTRVTAGVGSPRAVRLTFLAGYLAVWSGFAALAMLGDGAVDRLVGGARTERVLAAALLVAGLYQLSRAKHACLSACRSPWAFLWQHYGRGLRGGWTLGLRHGLFCLGCCWALMLVMVAAGTASLLWMLALTGAMVVEKTARRGARLVVPLGVALVLAGAAVATGSMRAAPDAPASAIGSSGQVALLVAVVALAVQCAARAVPRRRAAARDRHATE